MRIIKLRSKLLGNHIHTTFFVGEEGQTFVNNGTLIQDVGDWQLLGALIGCGAELNAATRYACKVVFEGDEEIVEELVERED